MGRLKKVKAIRFDPIVIYYVKGVIPYSKTGISRQWRLDNSGGNEGMKNNG